MNPKIKISSDYIKRFCQSHHIIKLSLFGSVLTDHFSEASDVDILVEFDPQYVPGLFGFVGMKDELAHNLGREIDLRTPEDISKLFRSEVIQQSYVLYEEGIAKLLRAQIRAFSVGFGFFAKRLWPKGYVTLRKTKPTKKSLNLAHAASFAIPSRD